MTNLYINNEHCLDLKQLEKYFHDLQEGTDIYFDLLDYSRHGDLFNWLNEHNEKDLASRVDSIDTNLGDSDYMNKLTEVINSSVDIAPIFSKPLFEKCADLSISCKDVKYDTVFIELTFKILLAVNENYEIKLTTGWGTKGFILNPINFEEHKNYQVSFIFHKRAGKEINELSILVDDAKIIEKHIPKATFSKATPELPRVSKSDANAKYIMASLIYHTVNILPNIILGLEYKLKEKEQLQNSYTHFG